MSIQSEIEKATQISVANLGKYTNQSLSELQFTYESALALIENEINQFVDASGNVRLDALQTLLTQVQHQVQQITQASAQILTSTMSTVATVAIAPFALSPSSIIAIPTEAVEFVQGFVMADGLKLSDRLWRLNQQAVSVVSQAIQQSLIQGFSAHQAAESFVKRGVAIPKEILTQMQLSTPKVLMKEIVKQMMPTEGGILYQAERLFRTELARAHAKAYEMSAFETPGVIGLQFCLSPLHRRRDICDDYAFADTYGLGRGVYPQGKCPFPAHPNTISYTMAVFS